MLRAAATSGVQQLDADSVSERLKEELEADDHATEGDDEDESFSEEKENNRPKEIQNKPKNKIPFMEKQLHTSNIVSDHFENIYRGPTLDCFIWSLIDTH